MRFYQTPLKNPAATSLSLLLGIVVIAATVLSLRVANTDRLTQQSTPLSETSPVDPAIASTQQAIQNDREQKLRNNTPREQKTVTETTSVRTTTTAPTPKTTAPIPAAQKSNRTTKTS